MNKRFDYDAVVKDVIVRDRPTLLRRLLGKRKIVAFLNAELPVVQRRVADLLLLLSDGTILHIEFQSQNDRDMPYRIGIYGLLIAQKYRKPIRQVVVYLGSGRIRMASRLTVGQSVIEYELLDIREIDTDAMLASGNVGDLALALLTRGGEHRLREIAECASKLDGPARERAFTQMAILSGLRNVSEELTLELKSMGASLTIDKNAFLREIRDNAWAGGREEGKVEILRTQLLDKFGPLPRWALQRLERATPDQADLWAKRILRAETLEAVIGRR